MWLESGGKPNSICYTKINLTCTQRKIDQIINFSTARQPSWADISTVQAAEESGRAAAAAAAAELVCVVLTLQACFVFSGLI